MNSEVRARPAGMGVGVGVCEVDVVVDIAEGGAVAGVEVDGALEVSYFL